MKKKIVRKKNIGPKKYLKFYQLLYFYLHSWKNVNTLCAKIRKNMRSGLNVNGKVLSFKLNYNARIHVIHNENKAALMAWVFQGFFADPFLHNTYSVIKDGINTDIYYIYREYEL